MQTELTNAKQNANLKIKYANRNLNITGKIIRNGHCPWTIHVYICGRIFLFILTLALAFICLISCQIFFLTSIVFLASCMDPIFQLVQFRVVNNIQRVMIPCVCIFYSNANINIMHESWGSFRLLFGTLSYQSTFDPFNWHLIFILCVYGRQTFFF